MEYSLEYSLIYSMTFDNLGEKYMIMHDARREHSRNALVELPPE